MFFAIVDRDNWNYRSRINEPKVISELNRNLLPRGKISSSNNPFSSYLNEQSKKKRKKRGKREERDELTVKHDSEKIAKIEKKYIISFSAVASCTYNNINMYVYVINI